MDAIEMGRKGGLTRARNMTAEERRESAIKASKAAARARKAKTEAKKKEKANPNSKYLCDMLIEKHKDGGGK